MKKSETTKFLQAQITAIREHFTALRGIYLDSPNRTPRFQSQAQTELNRLMKQQVALEAPVQALLSASLRKDLTTSAA